MTFVDLMDVLLPLRSPADAYAMQLRKQGLEEGTSLKEQNSMRILITGAAGMLGRMLTERLASEGRLGGREITCLTLHDTSVAGPPALA